MIAVLAVALAFAGVATAGMYAPIPAANAKTCKGQNPDHPCHGCAFGSKGEKHSQGRCSHT